MRTLFACLIAMLGLSALGQGTAVRSENGNATNLMHWTQVRLLRTNTTFTTLGTGFLLTVDGVALLSFQPGGLVAVSNLLVGAEITGNGVAVTNVPGQKVNWPTNAANDSVLVLNNGYQAISTNNNLAYLGFSGWSPGETNAYWTTIIWTNTSGALKTATFAGCIGDTTVYCTNQTAVSVLRYPKMGTNVVGRPLN